MEKQIIPIGFYAVAYKIEEDGKITICKKSKTVDELKDAQAIVRLCRRQLKLPLDIMYGTQQVYVTGPQFVP